jgi:hypothetical protein
LKFSLPLSYRIFWYTETLSIIRHATTVVLAVYGQSSLEMAIPPQMWSKACNSQLDQLTAPVDCWFVLLHPAAFFFIILVRLHLLKHDDFFMFSIHIISKFSRKWTLLIFLSHHFKFSYLIFAWNATIFYYNLIIKRTVTNLLIQEKCTFPWLDKRPHVF